VGVVYFFFCKGEVERGKEQRQGGRGWEVREISTLLKLRALSPREMDMSFFQ